MVARIERNVNRARSGRLTDEEFRTARRMVIALHDQENTTMAEQAQQAGLDELWGLGFDYYQGFNRRIEAVKLATWSKRRAAPSATSTCLSPPRRKRK